MAPVPSVGYSDGPRIVVNDLLIARKQIFYDQRPSQLWDIEMKAVSAEAFQRLVADAHCPSF